MCVCVTQCIYFQNLTTNRKPCLVFSLSVTSPLDSHTLVTDSESFKHPQQHRDIYAQFLGMSPISCPSIQLPIIGSWSIP